MGALLRGKMLDKLRRAHRRRPFELGPESRTTFDAVVDALHATDWIVYAKRPFGGAAHVVKYLGRYTHRIGISNARIDSLHDGEVTFRTKNGDRVTVTAEEFLARFVQHVLPSGFTKIRHYGLMAPCNATTKLAVARSLLQRAQPRESDDAATSASLTAGDDAEIAWRELFVRLTGVDLTRCRACGSDETVRRPLDAPARAPPEAA